MAYRFEDLETLRKAAWESIATRRKYEWQISISLWGLLFSFNGALVAGKMPVAGYAGLLLLIFPLVLCVAHYLWLVGLFHAYSIDKKDEGAFRTAMHDLIKLEPKYDVTAELRAKAEKSREDGPLRNWNTRSQILTTEALGYLAFYLVVARSCGTLATGVLSVWAAIALVVVHYTMQKKQTKVIARTGSMESSP